MQKYGVFYKGIQRDGNMAGAGEQGNVLHFKKRVPLLHRTHVIFTLTKV